MARSVDDVLTRRTRARLLARDASAAAAPDVAALHAVELGWNDAERAAQAARYQDWSLWNAPRRICPRPHSRRRSDSDVDTGARTPTPPIEIAGGAAAATARLASTRVEVDTKLIERLGDACSEVITDPATLAEASRDWWPLAMTWALDGNVAGLADVVARPTTPPRSPPCCASRTTPACRSPPRQGAAACAVRRSPCTAASCSISPRCQASSTSTTPPWCSTCRRARSATCSRTSSARPTTRRSATGRSRSTCRPSGAGWRAGGGQYSNRYGKIEDIVMGLDVVLADGRTITTGGAPRQAVGPDLNRSSSAPKARSASSPAPD